MAVDNGNITSDELHIGKIQLEKTIQRHLFQGSALVILCAGDKPGKVGLSVAGEKMKTKKLVLNTKLILKKVAKMLATFFSINFAISIEIRRIFRYKNAEFAIIPL